MNVYKKKIVAIVVACIVVAAAVGVPIAIGKQVGADVKKVSPVVNSISFYEWVGDAWVEIGASGLALAPYIDSGTADDTPIKIVADVTCGNGHSDIGSVTASFDDLASGDYAGSLTLVYDTGNYYETEADIGHLDIVELKSWVTSGNHDVTVTAVHKYKASNKPADGTLTVALNVAATKAILVSDGTLTFVSSEPGLELTPGVASDTATVGVTSLGNDAIAGLTVAPGVMTKVGSDETFNGATAITDPSPTGSKWGDISIAACTSGGTTTEDISFVLTIPLGTPAGSYAGIITIAVPA